MKWKKAAYHITKGLMRKEKNKKIKEKTGIAHIAKAITLLRACTVRKPNTQLIDKLLKSARWKTDT